jgi:hypothetical protein
VSAELSDESPPGFERRQDASDDFIGRLHPVKRGIAEDRVELVRKLEALAAAHPRVQI